MKNRFYNMFHLFFLPFLHYHITQHHIQDILLNHLIHAHGLNHASFLIYLLLPFFLLVHPSRAVHLLLLYACHHIHQILFALLHDIHFLYLQSLLSFFFHMQFCHSILDYQELLLLLML